MWPDQFGATANTERHDGGGLIVSSQLHHQEGLQPLRGAAWGHLEEASQWNVGQRQSWTYSYKSHWGSLEIGQKFGLPWGSTQEY